MLEGIEILNQTEIMTCPTWFAYVLLCGFGLLIVGLILYAIGYHESNWLNILSAILIAGGIITTLIAVITVPAIPTGKYTYQVTVDSSVSIIEFYDKYEIISQEGKIWTIREKE